MGWDVVAVREGLSRLAETDVSAAGIATGHGYRLRPTVDGATLARAERAIGMPLPAGYREFLTVLGDGGAGPYHGVVPLGEALDRIEDLDALGRDCPLTGDVDFGEIAGEPDDWDEHVARLDSDPEYQQCYDDLTATYIGDPWTDGRLPLVDYGCGDWLFLVVRGARPGTVWVDSVANGTGLYCLDVDFPTFYRTWLDAETIRAFDGVPKPKAYYQFLEYGANPRYRPVA